MNYKTVNISRQQFSDDYNSMTVDELCKKYQIAIPTVYSVLRRLDIPQKVGTENQTRSSIVFTE